MTKREKIIKGLQQHVDRAIQCTYATCDCPYVDDCRSENYGQLTKDVLDLLTVGINPKAKDKTHWYCGACGCRLPLKMKPKFCHKCGTKIGQWILSEEENTNENGPE